MNVIGSRNCTKYSCNNCAQFLLYIEDQWSANDTVSSSVIDDVLSLESSRIALALAGFVYIKNSTETEGNPVMSAGVPLASWICLILGVIVSSVIFFKPIWWDRCLKRLKKSDCCNR
ncbi:PREDICTED: uncharacterized protein LOC109584101 [Amphimedon queenslandica]|nr:PREDICTED: uncharacterized protein LOC109584101 [Amphimedon queenslandica]|eukprot:XP_019855258.1 PREDICTED: uncharacterized protein LOC109584101 [Amphimedon queenslandica]